MGLILLFWQNPTPCGLDVANDSLTAFVNMDVFDSYLLLPLASVLIQ